MNKLRIVYDGAKCIGAGMCALEDPDHFVMNSENKTELRNGQRHKHEVFHLDISTDDPKEVERIIVAARSCPVNAIGVVDLQNNLEIVSTDVAKADSKNVIASYDDNKEWRMDPLGYFLIRIDTEKQVIEAGHCHDRNIVDTHITGKDAREIFNTIIRLKLVGSLQHASYLGKELYKAELALKLKLKYVQDDELVFKQSP